MVRGVPTTHQAEGPNQPCTNHPLPTANRYQPPSDDHQPASDDHPPTTYHPPPTTNHPPTTIEQLTVTQSEDQQQSEPRSEQQREREQRRWQRQQQQRRPQEGGELQLGLQVQRQGSMGSQDVVGSGEVHVARSPNSIAHGPDDRLLHRKGSVDMPNGAGEGEGEGGEGPLVHDVLTKSDMERLDRAFRLNDVNGDGEISKAEFIALIKRLCAEDGDSLPSMKELDEVCGWGVYSYDFLLLPITSCCS